MNTMRYKATFVLALGLSLFQLIVPVFLPLVALQVRALHVMLAISTAVLCFPFRKSSKEPTRFSFLDLAFVAIILVTCLNIYVSWETIYAAYGDYSFLNLLFGSVLVLVVLDATRRATGWIMPLLVVFTFVFVFMGPIMPGTWRHPGLPLTYVIGTLYYSPEGLFGQITGFSATFIAVFVLFGTLLMHTGGGKTFMDLALLLAGRFRGGPAKVAVVSSALFGSISGSAAANVSVTGNYTIPLMIKLGYRPNFAAGVESMASTGGAITPPIMGIAAFIMAEFLDIPYIHIVGYALIPCILFYIGLFAGVHFEALSLKLEPVPREDLPRFRDVFNWSRIVPFSIPLILLVWLLLRGFVLVTAGFYSSTALIALYLLSDLSISHIKERFIQIIKALSLGGQAIARIAPIMVSVGVLVSLLDLTGVAPKLSGLILEIGGNHLISALILGALVPLVLGTALPATPSYIIAAAIVAPALTRLGIDVVAANMFLFYWAALSSVTPPTCTTVIIASNYANANWIKAAFVGMRLGIVAFLVPFFFVFEPALLGRDTFGSILIHTSAAIIGAVLLSSGLFGYMRNQLSLPYRAAYIIGGTLLLYPNLKASLLGLGISAATFLVDSASHRESLGRQASNP